jgi:hypothetical protein
VEWAIVIGQFVGQLVATIVFGGNTRSPRGSLDEIARRFPSSRVLRAELVTWPGLAQHEAATVRFVSANRDGLSFRDAYGFELLKVAPHASSGLELVESGEWMVVRARGAEGDPVDFWLDGVEPADGLAVLRAAALRAP